MFKKNIIKKIYILLSLVFLFFSYSWWADLLEKAFDPAMEQQWLINLWNTSDQVWNEILRESTNISIWWWITINNRVSLIVRIAKFLLRMTIVLSVTMVLYSGIMYILKSSKWEDPKDVQKNLILIWWWILLALASLWIINLISSVSQSSLNTGDDFWFYDKWWYKLVCKYGWDLDIDLMKKYIYKNYLN